MFGTSVFGVEKWDRGLVSFLAMGLMVVGAAVADDDVLIHDLFETGTFGGEWEFEASPDPNVIVVPPVIVTGNLEGTYMVRAQVPDPTGGDGLGGGIPGGICQNHRQAGQNQVGMWADFTNLTLETTAHFKLFTLSPDATTAAVAGLRLRQHETGVLKMRAYAYEDDGTRVDSVWATLPTNIVASEPLFFRAAWLPSSDAIQANGSFTVEVFQVNGAMLLGVSVAGLDNFTQYLSYPRFGLIEPMMRQTSSGHLDFDQVRVNEVKPVSALPLGGFGSGS